MGTAFAVNLMGRLSFSWLLSARSRVEASEGAWLWWHSEFSQTFRINSSVSESLAEHKPSRGFELVLVSGSTPLVRGRFS